MSLHAYIPPPPLALAITPAPPPKPYKPKEVKPEKKEVQDPGAAKADPDVQKKSPNGVDVKEPDQAHKEDDMEKDKDKEKDKEKTLVDHDHAHANPHPHPDHLALALQAEGKGEADVPQTPNTPITPMSMIPEPATPDPSAPVEVEDTKDTPGVKDDKVVQAELKKESEKAKTETKAEAGAEANAEFSPPSPEPVPLRLIGPPPHTPIRTRLDMNPTKIYPPIDTDPRGAYHLYAKGFTSEWLLIDVVKDGWMFEYWRGKAERDALDKLRGEDVRRAEREMEVLSRTRRGMRSVPDTAGELLVQLWNDLAEAPWNELSVETFWERYDWTSPKAQLHSNRIPDEDKKENKSVVVQGQELEWTRQGVEEILGTVGVQAVYNSDIPIHRRWTGSGLVGRDRAFLLMGHGHFMIRLKEWLVWKPQEGAGEFELLVTSGHDRIFGEMVKAQRMEMKKKEEEEYKKRKMAEREAKAKAEPKEDGGGSDQEGDKIKTNGKAKAGEGDEKNAEVKVEGKEGSKDEVQDKDKDKENAEKEQDELKGTKVMIALPVRDLKHLPEAIKHEQEPHIVAPAPVIVGENQGEQVKDKDEEKGVHVAEKLMEGDKDVKMGDIKAAFKALEDAAGGLDHKATEKGKPEKPRPDGDEDEQLIWTWAESCESWRWKNYEAGVHNLADGGWEERDWKVFADGRGVEEFEDEEEEAEVVEIDIHDWSC